MITNQLRYLVTFLFLLSFLTFNAQDSTMHQEPDTVDGIGSSLDYKDQMNKLMDAKDVLMACENAEKKELSNIDKFNLYLETGIRLYDLQDSENAGIYLNKAKAISSKEKTDSQLGRLYNYIGWLASDHNSYGEAIGYFQAASQYYSKAGQYISQGNAYNSIGAMYWYQRNYALALNYFNQAYELGVKSDDTELILKGLTNKGVVLNQLAQYTEALSCLEKALELNQVSGNDASRASLLNNMGNLHYALKQYQLALRYYNDAMKLYVMLEDNSGIGSCHNNLGEIYLQLGNIGAALDSYETSLQFVNKDEDSSSIAVAYVNIGRAHQSNKAYLQAVSYFERALKIMVTHEDASLEAETYLHLAQTVIASKHYSEAHEYLNKAITISKKIGEKTILADCYSTQSGLFEKEGIFKEALKSQKLYSTLKDSITDEQALINSARMEAVYNLLEKDATISKLEQDNISKEEDLERLKETRTLYLIISAALFGSIIFLILLFRLKRKTSIQLKEKNKELAQLNATKDKFFSIIAHDLKSPFSSLMGFAEMLCLHAETKNTKEVIDYAQVIHNSTKRLLGLVENLLQWSRTQLGTTEYKPMQIDVSIHTHNIVSLLRLNAEEKDIVISPKVEKDLVAWADLNLFSTVLRNLISNAIKFSRVGSVIYVIAQKKNDMIEVSVSDSGVGIRQENIEKLFQVDTAFTTKGTFNEKGTGIGLVLCKEFVEINKGSIWVESELEKGSTFTFTLPINNVE
ncbi:tetratricopeptide repeat-containing sensor histidine kinase [Carboxylicivirga caseinilyticus]|uniref:tetratricopeptide repeat-containing sensor histidine kinase n=1 Tax=Carboxylicivirga caseinilyticus TaxID=3417572 RepID=UPI003D348CA6|nr:tetratricopeptide repeat-containing sensor histidine kinase [Marinilabiliaceae bacterium A049]